jgi:hypothetical protein
MSMHPEVYFPLGKECHYWNNLDKKTGTAYRNTFSKSTFADDNDFKCGEITPAYANLTAAEIAQLQEFAPNVKIFYVIRDPFQRSWSAAKHIFRARKQDINKADPDKIAKIMLSDSVLSNSDYLGVIAKWRAHFGSESIQLIDFDEMMMEPNIMLRGLCRHIGIDDKFFDLIPRAALTSVIHTSGEAAIPSEVVSMARDRYMEIVSATEKEWGRELTSWRNSLA